MPDNLENKEKSYPEPVEDLNYNQLVESSVGDLFDRFKKMKTPDRINEVTAYCLARALAGAGMKDIEELTNEETRLEYIKEAGRNERSMIKSDGAGLNDDDDPLFTK